jgi:hypothetical protein
MNRILVAALICGLAAPALAEERPIGTGGSSIVSRSATAIVVVDPATGLPVAGTGGGPASLAINSVVAGAYATGALVDLGTTADAAYAGSGNSTAIAALKGIYSVANGATPAGTNTIGGTFPVGSTTGGATAYHLAGGTPGATTPNVLVSTGAHTVYSINAINTGATLVYLRIYDSAAAPTCSSATGALMTIPVPQAGTGSGAGVSLPFGATGFLVASGFGFCVTGGGADTDATNAAAGVYINATYK